MSILTKTTALFLIMSAIMAQDNSNIVYYSKTSKEIGEFSKFMEIKQYVELRNQHQLITLDNLVQNDFLSTNLSEVMYDVSLSFIHSGQKEIDWIAIFKNIGIKIEYKNNNLKITGNQRDQLLAKLIIDKALDENTDPLLARNVKGELTKFIIISPVYNDMNK